jgi:hypothetical protein
LADFGRLPIPGMVTQTGGRSINTQVLRARIAESRSVWIAALALPLILIAPALWNGYPLLQWDTGGYLARWYEGYLVPSRSTVFALYLHYGEDSRFWINLAIQALATLWILQITLRVLGVTQLFRLVAISLFARADHGAAMACQHTADGYFCRPVGAVAIRAGSTWRERFPRSKSFLCSALPPSRRRPTAPRWACSWVCAASAGSRALSCAAGLHYRGSSTAA